MTSYACLRCGRVSGQRYCEDHRGRRGGRPDFRERGYGQEFEHNRRQLLAAKPTCCEPGCEAPATVADHDPPRRVLIARGITNPDALHWLKPMCIPHHNAKAAREQ